MRFSPRVSQAEGVLLIFARPESSRVQKLQSREVNAVEPAAPEYLNWSEVPISFDQFDHPYIVPSLGRHALTVDPLVSGSQLHNILMNGCSSINILYASTLKKMGIP